MSPSPRSPRPMPIWVAWSIWVSAPRISCWPRGDAIFEGEVEIVEALGEVSLLYIPAKMSVGEGRTAQTRPT